MRQARGARSLASAVFLILPFGHAAAGDDGGGSRVLGFQRTAVVVAVRPSGKAIPAEPLSSSEDVARVVVPAPGDKWEERRLNRLRTPDGERFQTTAPGPAEAESARRAGESALVRVLGPLGPEATYARLESGQRLTEADLRSWAAGEGYDGLVLLRVLSYRARTLPRVGRASARAVVDAKIEAVVASTLAAGEPWRSSFSVRGFRDWHFPPFYDRNRIDFLHPLELVLPDAASELAARLRKDGLLLP